MEVIVNNLTADIFIKLPKISIPLNTEWVIFNKLNTTLPRNLIFFKNSNKIQVDLTIVKKLNDPDKSLEYVYEECRDSPIREYEFYLLISDFIFKKEMSKRPTINFIIRKIKTKDFKGEGVALCLVDVIRRLKTELSFTEKDFSTYEIDLQLSDIIGNSKKGENTWVLNEIISRSGKNIHNTRPSSL